MIFPNSHDQGRKRRGIIRTAEQVPGNRQLRVSDGNPHRGHLPMLPLFREAKKELQIGSRSKTFFRRLGFG